MWTKTERGEKASTLRRQQSMLLHSINSSNVFVWYMQFNAIALTGSLVGVVNGHVLFLKRKPNVRKNDVKINKMPTEKDYNRSAKKSTAFFACEC